ncbi:MAG: family 43 glycosylhydrolase [Mobilitalea sp.]
MKRRFKRFTALFVAIALLLTIISPPKAYPEKVSAAELPTPLVFYDFKDGLPSDMEMLAKGTTAIPKITFDSERGPVLDLAFGAHDSESYVKFPNPYSTISNLTGATMMLWVKVDPSASYMAYDNLIGFTGTTGRLTLQTMPYLCYNADGSWVDLKSTKDPSLSPGVWAHLTVTISDNNVVMYINGTPITYNYAGSDGDATVSDDAESMLTFLKSASEAFLGNGSFWGTQDSFLDSVAFYDSALSAADVLAAYQADPCVVPADISSGLAAYYSFDNGLQDAVSSNTATEVYGAGSKFGQAVTDGSKIDYIVGQKGRAVSFRGGENTGIALPSTITGEDYTISFWMNATDYVDWSSIIFASGAPGHFMNIMGQGWEDDGAHPQISFHRDPDEGVSVIDYVSGNPEDKALEGVWTNITYVVDQGEDDFTATLNLYVDGVKQKVFVFPSLQDAGEAIVNFFSGSQATMFLGINWWDQTFNGALDELYLYNRALSALDVAALHSKGLEKPAEGTVATPKSRVTVHDPSIVKDGDNYYIFGSHMAWAKSTDLENWTSFTNNINTNYSTIFEDIWTDYCRTDSNPNVSGNLWAPDVIWNEDMDKYCMYMSVNGDDWNSAIVLLTADNIEGPYDYVGPVVYSGFNTSSHDANLTDVYDVLGEGADLTRYQSISNTKINAIDANVSYDESGTLWMTFGSWFGGIYMLKLDKNTGLRDYTTIYTTIPNVSDQYYGQKIAGGYAVSGEGPYIMYDQQSDYYYLFVSYAGFTANGGYNMRLYRSRDIYGPYIDAAGNSAIRTSGGDNSPYGVKLMGNYTFDCLTKGYKAQGHNSAFVDDDGQMYLVYHTRFNDGTETHQVRVHQMFNNAAGWPVVAPYEYSGDDISPNGYATEEVTGYYEFINHGLNSTSEMLTTQIVKLNADHTITGDITGTWSMTDETYDMTVTIDGDDGVTYSGVFFRQSDESIYNNPVMTFSAVGTNNKSIWGSRIEVSDFEAVVKDGESLQTSIPAKTASNITLPTVGYYDTSIAWTSLNPDVLSTTGMVNRQVNDTTVTLRATINKGSETNIIQITVIVLGTNVGELSIDPIYRYEFDEVLDTNKIANDGTKTGDATLVGNANVINDSIHGNVLEISNADGAKKVNYLALPTDTFDGITTDGYTVGMWVNVDRAVTFDHSALFEANGGGQDQYPVTRMGVNLFSRINSNGKWGDATSISGALTNNAWHYVTYTVSGTGIAVYLDGNKVGSVASDLTQCFADNFLRLLDDVRVGSGNIWGDEDVSYAKFDNVVVYNKALTTSEAAILYNMEYASTSIDKVIVEPSAVTLQKGQTQQFTASLQGFNVGAPNVVWAVSGSSLSSTISPTGLLTVGEDETNNTFTVTAASILDTTKIGTATVTVSNDPEIELQVAEPVITTNPLDTSAIANNGIVEVTLSTATLGASIYYTMDGTTPTITSTKYNGTFLVSTTQTSGVLKEIKAIAVKDGMLNSSPAYKQIIFKPRVVTPTASPTAAPTPTASPTPTPVVVDVEGSNQQVSAAITTQVINAKISVGVQVSANNIGSTANMDLSIPIATESIVNQIASGNTKTLEINVKLPSDLLIAKIVEDLNIKLGSDLIQAATKAGSDISISVNNDQGRELYSWSFSGNDLANSNQEVKDVNLSLSVIKATDHEEINGLLKKESTQSLQNSLVVRFNNEGILPAQASVRIYVGNLFQNTDRSVYLYHYNQVTGRLETLPYSSNYQVNSEGYITINLLHCSDYVVLPSAASKDKVTYLLNQITIEPVEDKLFVGQKAKLQVNVPATLEIVKSLKDETSSSAIGGVTVSFQSKNTKVAKVDSNGKITAVGKGTTTIVTTIKLYNKKSMTATTKIIVTEPYIEFSNSKSKMKVGETFQFTIAAYGLDVDQAVWTTSKKSVVVINKNGKSTAKTKGTDYVKVRIGDVTISIKVVVK